MLEISILCEASLSSERNNLAIFIKIMNKTSGKKRNTNDENEQKLYSRPSNLQKFHSVSVTC